jgi:hypothetical protein
MSLDLWKRGVQWRGIRPDGVIRHSQIVSTYGPGALVDLVDDAAIVAGLSWWAQGEPVVEDRLLGILAKEPDYRNLKLYAPPSSGKNLDDPLRQWIKAFRFPEWFVCQNEDCWSDAGQPARRDGARPRRLLRINQLDGEGHKCKGGKGKTAPVQPIRFTRACRFGHIDDIEWFYLVHSGRPDADRCRRPIMWIDEAGASGDLADVRVACSGCGANIRMAVAAQRFTADKKPTHGMCGGRRPWLGADKSEQCNEPMRFLLRSASHAFFPVMASVIHIPDPSAEIREKITKVYDLIKNVKSAPQIDMLRDLQEPVRTVLEGISAEVAYAEVVRRRDDEPVPQKKPKEAEVEVLLACDESKNNERFSIRRVPLSKSRKGPIALIDKLVLLPRVTEVRALVGFTRFEPKGTDIDGELDIGAEVARIDDPMSWLPAIENSGEGFFFSLKETALSQWEQRPSVRARDDQFKTGFKAWQAQRDDRKKARDDFAKARYVLLHSLSHLLITAVSLECGYAASSIRERIYAGAGGSGILLYTAAPGSEGSLGGLVEVGRRLGRYLEHALNVGRLCSNDPVCAAHVPDSEVGGSDRHLDGASCHGCLLISEPSCERMNMYLDRNLVVSTVESADAAFFENW